MSAIAQCPKSSLSHLHTKSLRLLLPPVHRRRGIFRNQSITGRQVLDNLSLVAYKFYHKSKFRYYSLLPVFINCVFTSKQYQVSAETSKQQRKRRKYLADVIALWSSFVTDGLPVLCFDWTCLWLHSARHRHGLRTCT